MFLVSVPATSANVGAGFDCLGLALSMRGNFTFKKIEDGFMIKGCEKAYCNEDNLVYVAFKKTVEAAKQSLFGVEITIDCDIPLKRGLGSSAACIVAGCVGANALLGFPFSKEQLFAICTEMEGHPDNVAPALFGGLTLSFMKENTPILVPYHIHKSLQFMAVVPNTTVSTEEARKILPKQLSYTDAVFNIGHCAAFLRGLETGDTQLIKSAFGDRLHEPYRKQLIPEYPLLEQLCRRFDALALLISGSGSTMLIISNETKNLKQIEQELSKVSDAACHHLKVEQEGALVKEI
ncbi:MAG: homoserine kinase [Firmicutes bacterium]|uniref:Homoserine kinase n=1 Tax=Candidatus Scybalomonas excrementavium TaxID=2840943 RepID=A0A9D9I1G1_9FIRM|nr:homoserine kinase [Candidatus Scybalomonas excrementavium]